MALETESILRPNLGTSADVPDVPPRKSMLVNQMLVHFVREINGVVLDAEIRDHLQFRLGEDFADGIVRRVDHDHASSRAELGGEFLGI